MYKLITDRAAALRAHAILRDAFSVGASSTFRTLSTPGGTIPNATILVRRDLNLWAHFSDKPDQRKLLLSWFGLGEPSWQAAIEINIPVRRTLYCYTQLVTDDRGDISLAHKGGLGGGKYTIAPGPFADLIRGFEREIIQDGKREHQFFVLGSLSQPKVLLNNLSEFVHEAEKLRQLRRDKTRFKSALEIAGGAVRADGTLVGSEEYKEERGGTGTYAHKQQVMFKRIHAVVHRALVRQLESRGLKFGNRRQRHGLGPDLYVKDGRGKMSHLFEIKVGQDSQSTFTALGQLLVYSAGEDPAPISILVTPGLPRSAQFSDALSRHAISVLLYAIDERGQRVKFLNLDRVLSSRLRPNGAEYTSAKKSRKREMANVSSNQ